MQQVKERDEQAERERAAAERDARYRDTLSHERFCLPVQDQAVTRVERYTAYRDVDGRSVPMTVTRCLECGVTLVTPFEKETLKWL